MNFTNKIKRELLERGLENACCKQAALSAFIRATGSVGIDGGKIYFECVSESKSVIEYFSSLIKTQYGAEVLAVKKSRLFFVCRVAGGLAKHILSELGIADSRIGGLDLKIGIDRYLTENGCCALSYIKGAFLGGGSCHIPGAEAKSKGYHLEFVFSQSAAAEDFLELLKRFDIAAKTAVRKDSFIVYLKSAQLICDLLALMGASVSVLTLTEIMVRKTRANDINRAVNCQTGNLTKQFDASIKQIQAIRTLEESGRLKELPPKLYSTALARLSQGEMSLLELAQSLDISKSCLNHRLRKIIEISMSK